MSYQLVHAALAAASVVAPQDVSSDAAALGSFDHVLDVFWYVSSQLRYGRRFDAA